MSSTNEKFSVIADELQAIANLGQHYSKDPHDLDRYSKIRSLSAHILSIMEKRSPDEILEQLEDNTSHLSPLMGAEAAVFKDDQLLLMKRHDNGLWAIPGGLVDVGETLAEAAERELLEETKIRGHATKLLGIFDSRIWKTKKNVHLYHAIFLVESDSPNPVTTPEATEVGFFRSDQLPPLSPGHQHRVPYVFQQYRGEKPTPFFDQSTQNSVIADQTRFESKRLGATEH